MFKVTLLILIVILMQGCTVVRYNVDKNNKNNTREVNFPPLNRKVVAYVGDHLVKKGIVTEKKVLQVQREIDGSMYTIPVGTYDKVGYDASNDYYDATGVKKAALADPIEAIAVGKTPRAEVCIVSTFRTSTCYQGRYKKGKVARTHEASFQQTLIYSGRIGNKINISYREFSSDRARPAFNNEVEYDLSESKTIGYKGAQLKILKADNNSITYKVIRNFR